MSCLINSVEVELILDGIKYVVSASRTGPNQYFLALNNSYKEIEVHRMRDSSMLLSVDGMSFNTYMKEEVDRWVAVEGQAEVASLQGSAGVWIVDSGLLGQKSGPFPNFYELGTFVL